MNLRPKISIIMPVYNAEHRLSISIESVLNQTYNNIELLLINDGSTDSSSKICEYYVKKDERVKVFHQVNSGVSSARNRGLMEATGDYITFVDSDDTVDKEIYKEVVYKINSTNPDLVVFGMAFEYYKFNEIVKSKVMSFDIDETIESKQLVDYFFKLFKKNYLPPIWNKIIRTMSFVLIILVIAVIITYFEDIIFRKFRNVEDISDIYSIANVRLGGSAYLKSIEINTPLQFLIYSPVKAFYFLTSPLSMNWRGGMDIFTFLTDSMLYLFSLFYYLTNKNKLGTRRSTVIIILWMLLGSSLIFGIGVSNAGTAVRHRQKLIPVFLIILAIIMDCRKKLISKRNSKIRSEKSE